MKPLLKLLRAVKLPLVLSLLCAWAGSLSAAGLMAAAAYIITSAALQPPLYTLALAITAVRFCGIARAAFRYLERYLSHDAAFRLLGVLRAYAYEQMEQRVPLKLRQYSQGIFLNRLLNDIDILKDFYLRVFAPISSAFLMLLSLAALLSFYSLSASLILLAAFAFCLLVPLLQNQQHASAKLDQVIADYKNECIDAWQGISDIKANGYENTALSRLSSKAAKITHCRYQSAKTSSHIDTLVSGAASLALLALFACLIPLVRSGELTGIILGVLLLSTQSGMESLLALPEAYRCLETARLTARNFFTALPPQNTVTTAKQAQHFPSSALLTAENICFSYESGLPILQDISFSIQPGERVAIIGTSGSGKSTLFNLLLRLWDAQSGSFSWQGTPYSDLTNQFIRENIRAITQNTYIFSTTIRDNFQKLYPAVTDPAINTAMTKAQLTEFLAALPLGLDTYVGENGCQLSGGQRQRLAIARALVEPAKLILLDEPTTGLDNKTAEKFMQTLLAANKGTALLFITHDLRLLNYMDRTLLLKDGHLSERSGKSALTD